MARQPRQKRTVGTDGQVRVAGKAANGEGSVYVDNGSWRATWVDRSGKRRTGSGPTREKALARRAATMAEDAAAPLSLFSSSTTVAELAR